MMNPQMGSAKYDRQTGTRDIHIQYDMQNIYEMFQNTPSKILVTSFPRPKFGEKRANALNIMHG